MIDNEEAIHIDDVVQVTDLYVTTFTRTYLLAHVTSFGLRATPSRRAGGVVVAIFGGAIFLSSLTGGELTGCFATLGLVLLVLGLVFAAVAKRTFVVQFAMASGERHELKCADEDHGRRLLQAFIAAGFAQRRRGERHDLRRLGSGNAAPSPLTGTN